MLSDYLTKCRLSSVASHLQSAKLEPLYVSQHLWEHKLQIKPNSSKTPNFNFCFLFKYINLLMLCRYVGNVPEVKLIVMEESSMYYSQRWLAAY